MNVAKNTDGTYTYTFDESDAMGILWQAIQGFKRVAGQLEHAENTSKHIGRQWDHWRRRQARKQNRRRN